jgi:hypothetical protein
MPHFLKSDVSASPGLHHNSSLRVETSALGTSEEGNFIGDLAKRRTFMNKDGENPNVVPVNDESITDMKAKRPNRRQFLGGVSGVAAAAATAGAIGLEPLVGDKTRSQRHRLFAIRRISGPRQACATESKQQKPRTSPFPNNRTMATPKDLRISAEITARRWLTTPLACPTWLPTRA